jgi:AraC family transcriptional regulator
MEDSGLGMDDLDRDTRTGEQALLATQVAESRTFFLQLAGPWREPVTVALGGWERCRSDYAVARERYPYLVLELVTGGRGRVSLDGAEHRLEAGVCFACGPRTRVRIDTEAAAPLEKFFFALAGPGATRAVTRAGLLHGRARRVAALGELRELAEDMTREGRRHGAAAPAICARLAEVLLLKIGEEPARAASLGPTAGRGGEGAAGARENFERCRALIDQHAAAWHGLGDVAAAARLDGSSVCRLFRRFLGVSPHQYLRRRKMALAAAYLLERGGRVQDAAARVGMDDPYHFSRAFKAVHGVPPSALLAARR